MKDRGTNSNTGVPLDHEHYFELCALATSGSLNDEEWSQLQRHLAKCAECNCAIQEYREIARTGMALLMPDRQTESVVPSQAWSAETAKQELFGRIARGEGVMEAGSRVGEAPKRRKRSWLRGFRPMPQPALGYAAAAFLLLATVVSTYEFGVTHGVHAGTAAHSGADQQLAAQISQMSMERNLLESSMNEREREIRETLEQLQLQVQEVQKWKALSASLNAELASQKAGFDALQRQYTSASGDRDLVSRKLQESETRLHTLQQKYDNMQTQQLADSGRNTGLESRIAELSARLKDAEATVHQQQEFLAADRDVRELMGARNLYIADVYDVNRKGETAKPYGRVFYTTGKSLIFYAFDLDRQPHVRDASNFQLWGRRGVADHRPVNMGIFYLDSAASKRWVLKFDDPDMLAKIDAVFVTVEPKGGSSKPSGKQLLFASLRAVASNHP